MRAIVIEDSRVTRAILRQMLEEIGFEVSEAGDGCEALERLRQIEKPDLALVDWNMPEMNGYDFVRTIRADPAYDDMRLMMVTTETELSQVAKALDAGADEYAMEPFTHDVILQKLELMGISL